MSAGNASAQGSSLTDEMLLSDELLEVPRAHAGSQGLPLGRWLEERLRTCATGAWTGRWHGTDGSAAAPDGRLDQAA